MAKLYKTLLLLTIIVAFNACKKDDSPQNLILGKWKMTARQVVDTKGDHIEFESNIPPADSLYISYYQNGKGVATYPDQADKGFSYTVKDSKLTYIVDGTDLEPITYDILSLTKSELKLYMESFDSDLEPTLKTKITITYTK